METEKRPSTEFRAFFTVVSICWVTLIFGVFIGTIRLIPDDCAPHLILLPATVFLLLIGAVSLIVCPLHWIWGIASGRY